MKTIKMSEWGFGLPPNLPVIISGPCSAESLDQVMKTCEGVARKGTHILRAGIWKPRTRPNSFEGMGDLALPWIKLAGRKTGLPVTVEVANARHVEKALAHGIDILWIGARTTVNPFAVQEIVDALKGIDIPVFIKNPINPDLELWIGAIERFYLSGLTKIAAIHRGFHVPQSAPYRNRPKWEIPIELQRRIPGLEVLCDPSHICGNRMLLLKVAQKALDLNFNGLMVESHINPETALSDAQQQLTPDAFGALLEQLVFRKSSTDDPVLLNRLESLREEIDVVDKDLFDLLAQRVRIVREIGVYKKDNDIQILQMERWMEIFKTRMRMGLEGNLSERFTNGLINALHQESIRHQTEIMHDLLAAVDKVGNGMV